MYSVKEDIAKHLEDESYSQLKDLIFRCERNKKDQTFYCVDEANCQTFLHCAVLNSSIAFLEVVIESYSELLGFETQKYLEFINFKDYQGLTALHFSANRGNLSISYILLKFKADPYCTTNYGLNVLHLAAQGDQPQSVIYFSQKYNISIEGMDEGGSTPLHWACYLGSELTMDYLLSQNVEVNTKDKSGLSPLSLAILAERRKLIIKLLQKGARTDLIDCKGRTPVQLAIEKKKFEIASILKQSESSCQLFSVKPPTTKISRSNFNVYFFIVVLVLFELISVGIVIPKLNFPHYYLDQKEKFSVEKIFLSPSHLLVTNLCFFSGLLIVYLLLIFSDPGKAQVGVKIDWVLEIERMLENKELVSESIKYSVIQEHCFSCSVRKADCNWKHCAYCEVCIRDMDHHCFWVNNCIGKKNLKKFYLFLFFLFVFLTFCITSSLVSYFSESQILKENFPFHIIYCKQLEIAVTSIQLILAVMFMFPVITVIALNMRSNHSWRDIRNPEQKAKDCDAKPSDFSPIEHSESKSSEQFVKTYKDHSMIDEQHQEENLSLLKS